MGKLMTVLAILVLAGSACNKVPVAPCRAFYNAVEPRCRKSILEQEGLTDSQRRALLQPLLSFDRMLTEAEK